MAKATKSTSSINPVMVLAGEELFLRNQQLADIETAVFEGEDPGMGFVRIDPTAHGSSAMAVALDECRMPSMFAPKKLVVVSPADALFKKVEEVTVAKGERAPLNNREILENYIESPSDSAVLVLVCDSWLKSTRIHKLLDKVGAVRWCEPIKPFQVPSWITARARDFYQKNMEPQATQRLAELIGPDLQRLDNELSKLSLYEPDSPAISLKAVDALVGFQHEQQIWDMINALALRDAPTALKKIDELWALDPKIEYTATGAVFSWLGQVCKARELIDRRLPDGTIIAQLKLWPQDRAQKILSLARSWGLDGTARWSEEILKMDLANKSSLGDSRSNLEKFVVLLCTAE